MSRYVKTDKEHLAKEIGTHLIVNTNRQALVAARALKRRVKADRERLESVPKLEQDIADLKAMLEQLLNSKETVAKPAPRKRTPKAKE